MLPRRHQPLLWLLWGTTYAAAAAGVKECRYTPSSCLDESCKVTWECGEHSQCGTQSGCVCGLCYGGDACDLYDDGHPVVVEKSSVEITVQQDHSGVVYQITATDADASDTCGHIRPADLYQECPCGGVKYGPLTLMRPYQTENPFFIGSVTGQIRKRAQVVMEAGETYYLQALVEPFKTLRKVSPQIVNVTVTVSSSSKFAAEGATSESAFLHNADAHPPETEPSESRKLSRKKRDTMGSGAAAANMTLNVIGTDPTSPLLPGQSVSYELVIIVPQLSSAMDLLVEIFVMDAVSGITPLALCSVDVKNVGSMIKDGGGNAVTTASFTPELKENAFFPGVNDRATINFGNLKNGAATGGSNYDDSTIRIAFKASLIPNPKYLNTSAIVTAGAEYDADNYVWVSQASYSFDMNAGYSYPSKIDIDGPDVGAPYSGATFTITAIITDPVGPLVFEVYTPNKIHNKFTVSNLVIVSVGSNLQCTGIPVPEYEYFYSVDKRTRHRGVAKFDFVITGLVYPDLVAELTDMGNKIELAFTVFFVDAVKDEIVSVGAGLTIGSTTLWTSLINVTMQDPITTPQTGSSVTYTVANIGSDRTVAQYGVLTYGISMQLGTAPGGASISCTANPASGYKITGVMWGNSGANIALQPNLTDCVTWDATDGVTAWKFDINSTGQIPSNNPANTAILEVTVQYLTTSVASVTVDCGGNSIPLGGAISGSNGALDVTGTAEPINPNDTAWYLGGQQALLVRLNFPPGGKAYSNMTIETSGDFDVTAFGAKVCKLEIMQAGRAVPTLGGPIDMLNSAATLTKISTTSLFDDGAQIQVGPIAGANRGTQTADGDNEVVLRMTYFIPKNQTTVTALTYNMSMGIQLNADLIWTGWSGFATTTAVAPSAGTTLIHKLTMPASTTLEIGRPTLVKFHFKMAPGSVDKISIKVYPTAGSATLYVCRILILAIGSSYPCLDPDPYGKEKINLAQPNTIIHSTTDWGAEATLDLGVLRNVGYQEYFADEIADSDAIEVGVLVRGVAAGSDTLNIDLISNNGGTTATNPADLTVAGTLTSSGVVVSAEWKPADKSNIAYDGVMKIIDLVIAVPKGYSQLLKVVISNADPASMKLCFAAVAAAGKNVPCVLPHTIIPVVVDTDTLQKYTMDLTGVCYYGVLPGNANESTITIRTGIQFTLTGSTGKLTATITENDVAITNAPAAYSITKSSTAFDPTSINTTTAGFQVQLVDNSTTDMHPGLSLFFAVNIIIPPDTTGRIEVGAMAPTDGGRAYATLHGVRWANVSGKNVGCMLDMINYEVKLLQNSSLSVPMIHESQTDTMVANLGYLTNTGLSYMQNFPTEPDDNALGIEVEIMMADHPNATTNSVIPVSFAVKFGDVIYVVTKNLNLVRDAALDLMVLRTELNYTTVPTNAYFSQKDQIPMTFRVSHVMNESRQELNQAVVRVLLPKPVQFVAASDTQVSNITANFTNNHYLDFAITNLFFTDYLEINLTVTVDPKNDMVKGLGLVDAAALVRMVCTTFVSSTPKYCGVTTVLPFQIEGTECYNSLNVSSMVACQFSASTAISAAEGPDKAVGTGGGWSPAVRSGPGWEHHITIDFLKSTRVTKIEFASTNVAQFRISYSFNGISFIAPCQTVVSVASNTLNLPPDCRFDARYGRLTIADAGTSSAFSVKFADWFGCPMESVNDNCVALATVFTDAPAWRQIAEDATNSIFYFCDYSPKKLRTVCFSSADDATWNALPSYIGSLVGESGGMFYASDTTGTATVSSTDGISWVVTDSTTAAGLTVTAKSVPGNAGGFASITVGSYKADFTGVMVGSNYIVKWESCCG